MTKGELIKTYEELKSQLEIELQNAPNIKHMDSYKKGTTALEIFTFVIEDIKNLNEETVKRRELIDFTESLWHSCNLKGDGDNIPELVDYYLKSINE